MLNLKGKVAVVTGCGSHGNDFGNGRAIATTLARQGAKIIGTDIDETSRTKHKRFYYKRRSCM
jgi:NAD(P)-dependent dehydrogenase (short-subunit alcohol dehydrogenase family)